MNRPLGFMFILLTAGRAIAALAGATGLQRRGRRGRGVAPAAVPDQPIVARPDEDLAGLRDEAVAEVAVAGRSRLGPEDIAPWSFCDARTAALDMAGIDGRLAGAVDGADDALEAIATPAATDELLYAGDSSQCTGPVVRGGPVLTSRITAVDARATPATMTVEAVLTGRRHRENRDTTTVADGSTDTEVTFTESAPALGNGSHRPTATSISRHSERSSAPPDAAERSDCSA